MYNVWGKFSVPQVKDKKSLSKYEYRASKGEFTSVVSRVYS